MKHLILIATIAILSFSTLKAQNLFIIGNKSYPSTETFSLKSNSDFGSNDLSILIAKDGTTGIIVVSVETMTGVLIRGKLIIYLDDGTVISCIDRGKYDYVDNIATTVFYLTKDELEKMKTVNINTIRYTLKCGSGCSMSPEEGNFSASNKESGYGYGKKEKTDVPNLIWELFGD